MELVSGDNLGLAHTFGNKGCLLLFKDELLGILLTIPQLLSLSPYLRWFISSVSVAGCS